LSQVTQSHELIAWVQLLLAWGRMQITSGVPVQILSQITKRLSAFIALDTSTNLDLILSLWKRIHSTGWSVLPQKSE